MVVLYKWIRVKNKLKPVFEVDVRQGKVANETKKVDTGRAKPTVEQKGKSASISKVIHIRGNLTTQELCNYYLPISCKETELIPHTTQNPPK